MKENICKSCEAKMDADALFCNECGMLHNKESFSQTNTQNEIIQCPQCDASCDTDAVFCSKCAYNFTQRQVKKENKSSKLFTCPNCNKICRKDDKFCRHCAFDLEPKKTSSAMFCTGCGNPFEPTEQFCNTCSKDLSEVNHTLVIPTVSPNPNIDSSIAAPKPLSDQSPVSLPSPQNTGETLPEIAKDVGKSSGLQWISPSAAGIALICFFLPWVEVSCNAFGSRVGGRAASGADLAEFSGGLWIIPLLAIGIIVVFFIFKSQKRIWKSRPYIFIGAGVALLFMFYKFLTLENTLRNLASLSVGSEWKTGLDIQPQFGIFGVILGFIGSFLGGVIIEKKLSTNKNPEGSSQMKHNIVAVISYSNIIGWFLLTLCVNVLIGGFGRIEFFLFSLIILLFPVYFLLKTPYKTNLFIRFHTLQSLFLVAILLSLQLFITMSTILFINNRELIHFLRFILVLVLFAALFVLGSAIFCLFKAKNDENYKLPIIGDLAMKFAHNINKK